MVLEYVVPDDGYTGLALIRHRGVHDLFGKGESRRLAMLLPSLLTNNGTAACLSFRLVEWLVCPFLFPDITVRDKRFYEYLVGIERMGAALDCALSKIRGDSPRPPAVLRSQLRLAAEQDRRARGSDATEYEVGEADLYEVAISFPTGPGIDGIYDWLGFILFKDLLCAAGSLAVYGEIAQACSNRFDPEVCLVAGGVFDDLARTIQRSVDREEVEFLSSLQDEDLAAELTAWLRRVLPSPDDISKFEVSRASSLRSLRVVLKSSYTSHASVVTPSNVMDVIQHHEAALLVIGNNVGPGGTVGLNMVMELLRLSLNTTVSTVALAQLATGMQALADLLPSLRSERIKSLPPRDRLSFVAKELTLWREAERTSSRGGGDGGRVPSSVGTDDAKEHVGVGYPAAYQVQLRRLLASEAYQDAETIVKNYMDSGAYAEAISSIFATGMFPLVHALIGKPPGAGAEATANSALQDFAGVLARARGLDAARVSRSTRLTCNRGCAR